MNSAHMNIAGVLRLKIGPTYSTVVSLTRYMLGLNVIPDIGGFCRLVAAF